MAKRKTLMDEFREELVNDPELDRLHQAVLATLTHQRCRHARAARLLGYKFASIQRKDFRDRLRIPYFYVGGQVRYDEAELLHWLGRQQQQTSTNDVKRKTPAE